MLDYAAPCPNTCDTHARWHALNEEYSGEYTRWEDDEGDCITVDMIEMANVKMTQREPSARVAWKINVYTKRRLEVEAEAQYVYGTFK